MAKVAKILGAVVVVVIVIVGIIFAIGSSRINEKYEIPASNTLLSSIRVDSSAIANGGHLVVVNGCTDCHGGDLSGKIIVDAPPFLVAATNLTSGKGGIGGIYSDSDLDRALRYGVKPDGEPLVIMPSKTYHNFSDEDAHDILAYIKSAPPVDNELPQKELRFLGKILVGLGEINIAEEVHLTTERSPKPAADSNAVYGKYLGSITCIYCHGADLTGGPNPENPDEPVPGLGRVISWDYNMFKNIMRTGELPEGRKMSELMPWRFFAQYTDLELKAIYAYITQELK
jgi:cytochrome c553